MSAQGTVSATGLHYSVKLGIPRNPDQAPTDTNSSQCLRLLSCTHNTHLAAPTVLGRSTRIRPPGQVQMILVPTLQTTQLRLSKEDKPTVNVPHFLSPDFNKHRLDYTPGSGLGAEDTATQ